MDDKSSRSNPGEVVIKHLDWTASVDFGSQTISGTATYTIKRVDASATHFCLDTSRLGIERVFVDGGKRGSELLYELHPLDPSKEHLGQKLSIALPLLPPTGEEEKITIGYSTTSGCTAIQWLPPSQTAGKKFPYLFSQCQAIHARSLVPCQDSCGVKMTYSANITVPSWATCAMSALLIEELPGESDGARVFRFEQPIPISSYLLAMAVGDLVRKDLSDRCAIYSEPGIIEAAAYEFQQTEEFLKIAEELAGTPYIWGRYDLLCLPPSFPYGGMENPCLTFVTPTLLAGDRSLADVVAHEIAHSWTGNLITNETWNHFWLNEGWTTWFQRKIMARIHDDDTFLDFDAIGRRKDMQQTIQDFLAAGEPGYTKLILPIGDNDPDDSYSILSYEKGFTLLLSLERRVGSEAFVEFFRDYVKEFGSKLITSAAFRQFFVDYFRNLDSGKHYDKIKDVPWDAWYNEPGMPPELPPLDQTLASDATNLAKEWIELDRRNEEATKEEEEKENDKKLSSWSSLQITCFLDALQQELLESSPDACSLKRSTLRKMNRELYPFEKTQNSEILHRYCELAIAAQDPSILPIATRFITTQGRMKFVRPLYKCLYQSGPGFAQQLAVATFLENKDFYHPICIKMIASDLSVGLAAEAGETEEEKTTAEQEKIKEEIYKEMVIETRDEGTFSYPNLVRMARVGAALITATAVVGFVLVRARKTSR